MRDESLFPLFAELDSLSGVGPRLKPALARLIGGNRVWDLLLHLPERWLVRQERAHISDLEIGENACFTARVDAHFAPKNAAQPYRIRLVDETGYISLVFFRGDARWISSQLPMGQRRLISGQVESFNGERQIIHPDHICDPEHEALPPLIEPIYALSAKITQKRLHNLMEQALALIPALDEWIEEALLKAHHWPSLKSALMLLHCPQNDDQEGFNRARQRIAYDEALARELVFARARQVRQQRKAPPMPKAGAPEANFLQSLDYTPTRAQIRAAGQISADMAAPHPMRRMLQGDVGSGKTLVGAMAAIQAVEAGFQVAFMAPTEVLARQQYASLAELFTVLGYEVSVLTGRDKGKARQARLMALADGEINIICGTHALFQDTVTFKNLGLIIVDEQHRFGVMDRARLAHKAESPHILVMSATPIPRTLAQTLHGDLELSVLDEKPPGRRPVTTRIIANTRLDEIVAAVGRACARGEQAFWVCPKVDAEEEEGASAVARHRALQAQLNLDIGLVHGRIKPREKEQALEDFRACKTRILVATTVIEVGVDVPSATIMVIEEAEKFGLSQLHQLRGRVGRSDKPAFCLLVYKPPLGEMGKKRLETLRETEDGFLIAEADFKLRGAGDQLGLRQSGLPNFRVLNLARDADLLAIAHKDMRLYMEKGAGLHTPRADALIALKELMSPHIFTDAPD